MNRKPLTDAYNCAVRGPDQADNLPKNSRPTNGPATLKERQPTWTVVWLWSGDISLPWQTVHHCLWEATLGNDWVKENELSTTAMSDLYKN